MTTTEIDSLRPDGDRVPGLFAGGVTMLLGIAAALLPVVDWPTARIVGWLLFLAGAAELGFAATRRGRLRTTAIVSGLLTSAAGLIFVLRPVAPYFPVANLVTMWLLVRGAWVLGRANQETSSRATFWLGATGGMDLLLGVLLVSGLPIAMLVVTLFGPTAPIVASFSYILAASLLVTGLAEIAISR